VLKHPDFEIDGQNVIWRTTIKKSQNKKGHEVTIRLPEGGTRDVPLPGMINDGQFLNISKVGIPNYGTKLHYNQLLRQAGNLHVHFTVIDDTPWLVKKAKTVLSVLKYT
jgi:DnaJ-class molecular chaperone